MNMNNRVGVILGVLFYCCLAQVLVGSGLFNSYDHSGTPAPAWLVIITGLSAGYVLLFTGGIVGLIFAGLCDLLTDWHGVEVQLYGGAMIFSCAVTYFVLLPFTGVAVCIIATAVFTPLLAFGFCHDHPEIRNSLIARFPQLGPVLLR